MIHLNIWNENPILEFLKNSFKTQHYILCVEYLFCIYLFCYSIPKILNLIIQAIGNVIWRM